MSVRWAVWLKRLGWAVGGVLGLLVLAWLAVPPILKWQAQQRLTEVLGRQVTIGDVSFVPWRLDLTVSDLTIAGTPGTPAAGGAADPGASAAAARPAPAAASAAIAAAPAAASAAASAPAGAASATPLLHVARIHANVSMASVFKRAPVIEALEIDAPQARLTRTAPGHYDIDDLIARFTPSQPAPAGGEPIHFALYNVQVRNAALRFDDRPVGEVHQLDQLRLDIPFASNLPAEVEVKVQPRLAFRLNGAVFDSGAQATPFAQTRRGDLKFGVPDVDLEPYLGYLPASLPVKVTRGHVASDLAIRFEAAPGSAPSLVLQGSIGVRDLATTDATGAPLLAWQRLQLELRDVQPLARQFAFGALSIDGAELHAARNAQGEINLLALAASPAPPPKPAAPPPVPASQAGSGAAAAASAASGAASAVVATVPPPLKVSLDSLALTGAKVIWADAAVQPAAALQLADISIKANKLQWPIGAPMPVGLSARLQGNGTPASIGSLKVDGTVTDHDARLDVSLADLTLAGLAPYVAQVLVPNVTGKLGADATIDWSGADKAERLRVALKSATLSDLRVDEPDARRRENAALSLKQLTIADATIDVRSRQVAVGSVKLSQPSLRVRRDEHGQVNLLRWQVGAPAHDAPEPAKPEAAPPDPKAGPTWQVKLKEFAVTGGELRLADAASGGRRTVRLQAVKLDVGLQNLLLDGSRTTAPAQLQVSAKVGSGGRDAPDGGVTWKGEFGLLPVIAQGTVRIDRLPIHAIEPYLAAQLPVTLRHADAGYAGQLVIRETPRGFDVDATGDALLSEVRVDTLPYALTPGAAPTSDELLTWQTLALKKVKVKLKPPAMPRIEIGEAGLDDFYARLVVTEQGRFNLQTAAPAGAASAVPPAGAASASPIDAAADAPAVVAAAARGIAPPAAAASAALPPDDAASEPPSRLPVRLAVGATKLSNGRVDFSDHYVKPNYSAQLTELNGALGAFNSALVDMATLELRGKAAGTATLEINGALNPSTNPPVMDIRAKATDLELAPLSPYAGKYAGYAIERGKLSMSVAYKIDADGKLVAANQVIVNQLTFGDKIESPDATKLPVLLAVALLKDRNGVIDLDLPLTGSLKDPQFSIARLILKVIGNLLVKAVTAPFALLTGGGGGGGTDISQVAFEPGTTRIAAAGQEAVDKVAKALNDRPALRMTVTGAADPTSEREAFQRAALENRLQAERKRQAARASEGATLPAPTSPASAPPLSPDEREQLLKTVYKETDLPNKPRYVIGINKSIPAAEMESMLSANIPVNLDLMRDLALQRGVAVREALVAKGITSDRLFLAAPKLRVSGEDDTAWAPRVELTLSAK
jgi:hypothetical protein